MKNQPAPIPSQQPHRETEPAQHATRNGYDTLPDYKELAWPVQ